MKIRISLPPVFTTCMCPKCCAQYARSHTVIQTQKFAFQTKMEKKKGKVDNAEDEKEEEGKKEDESDPTPSVGLFELVTLNLGYTS